MSGLVLPSGQQYMRTGHSIDQVFSLVECLASTLLIVSDRVAGVLVLTCQYLLVPRMLTLICYSIATAIT